MSFSLNRMTVSLALTTALITSGEAWAQQQKPAAAEPEPDVNVTVQDRPRPDFDALGVRAGSFLIFPSLTVSGQYDDNVFATNKNTDSDVTAIVKPDITARSDWNRNAMNFGFGVTGAANYEYQSNDYLDGYALAGGRLDITRDDALSGFLRVDRLHDSRDNSDSGNNFNTNNENRGNLNRYWVPQADTQYRHNFNRVYTVVGANVKAYRYEQVGSESQDDKRDYEDYSGRLRVGYELSPRFSLFTQGNLDYRDYEHEQNYGGELVKRNSTGYQARVGSEFDITGVIFGEMALTYSGRNYDESQFNDTSGFGGNGQITWNVTPLTTVIFDADSSIDETTVQYQGDVASSKFKNRGGLDVTHELLRNVLLNANTSIERDDFEGTSRTDYIWGAGAGVTYLINRNLSLDATYRYSTRSSDDESARYDRNIFLVGLTAKL